MYGSHSELNLCRLLRHLTRNATIVKFQCLNLQLGRRRCFLFVFYSLFCATETLLYYWSISLSALHHPLINHSLLFQCPVSFVVLLTLTSSLTVLCFFFSLLFFASAGVYIYPVSHVVPMTLVQIREEVCVCRAGARQEWMLRVVLLFWRWLRPTVASSQKHLAVVLGDIGKQMNPDYLWHFSDND